MGETFELCARLAALHFNDLPQPVLHEAKRGVLDWIGVALAGSRHPTIDRLLCVLQQVGGRPRVRLLGRRERLGLLDAAVANGQMGHLLDFDDTHMGGVILHTSSPVLAALLSLAQQRPVRGPDLLLAYVVGFEAGVRVGRAAPGHHRGGWHLTGTLGSLAAGAATARLLGLDAQRFTYALGIAATQAAGMQQNRGTMCKSFHAGKAAANGLLAALLAEVGFDSSPEIVEGKRGFARIYSDVAEPERLLADWGDPWEITRNGYKPYPCGVVLHPVLDGVIRARGNGRLDPAAIRSIKVRVHPLVLQVTGVAEPRTGLQSKFSVYHAAAVAALDGGAGIEQFTDPRAMAPDVLAVRARVQAVVDNTLASDQAHVELDVNGQVRPVFVEHASGTVQGPLSDAAIEAKFFANATPVLGRRRAARLCHLVWQLDRLDDVRRLTAACAAGG